MRTVVSANVENHIPDVTEDLMAAVKDAVTAGALAVEALAKMRAPVRTGFLRGSIQAMPARRAGGVVYASVNVAAEYGVYVEFGHHGGRGRKPYLVPATEMVRPKMQRIVQGLIASRL